MNFVGHWLAVHCFKHDGTIHRCWDRGLVLENTEDYIVIGSKRAKVTESNGRTWFTKEPAITIFSKNEWWNVICMIKDNGVCYYCNLASPCIVDKKYIKYIDYDLDLKLFPNDDTRLLDEKEYLRHKDQYHYEAQLDEVLRYQTKEILNKMHKREFPFDDQTVLDFYDEYLKEVKR